MTKKNKKITKTSLIVTFVGLGCMFTGLAMLIIKALSKEYIDTSGILHEKFFLLPIGFSFVFIGIIILIVGRKIYKTSKKK